MPETSRNVVLRSCSCFVLVLLFFAPGLVNTADAATKTSMLTCNSPCQDVSGSSPQSNTIPCTITYNCNSELVRQELVPIEEGPVAANGLVLSYHNRTGPDDLVYISVSAEWNISATRIELLRGYVFRFGVDTAGPMTTCLTVTFNRTLTSDDAMSKLSLDCLFGNLTEPDNRYSALVRSLPVPVDDASIIENMNTPSCWNIPEVVLCKVDNKENWIPDFDPTLVQLRNGTVKVTFWPARVQAKYPVYTVTLFKVDPPPVEWEIRYIDVADRKKPAAFFDNVQTGSYIAQIGIRDCYDCTVYTTEFTNITAIATAPPPPPTAKATNSSKTVKPKLGEVSSPEDDPQLSLAVISGALGGFLGLILFIVVLYLSCKWKISLRRQESEELHKDHYADDGLSDSFLGIDNPAMIDSPSMIPQTIHSDMTKASDFYAHVVGQGKGDSISSIAVDVNVDVHSCSNGHHVYKAYPSHESQLDSGFETIPEVVEDSGESQSAVLSLALSEPLGDLV